MVLSLRHEAAARCGAVVERREDAFGHGVLDIYADGRTAQWTWKSNTGSHAVSTDSVVLRRDVAACPQRGFGMMHA